MSELETEISVLEKEVTRLEKLIVKTTEEAKTKLNKAAIRIFLGKLILPYIDGLSEGRNVTPEEGIKQLIEENNTIDKIATNNHTETDIFLKMPELNVLRSVATEILNNPNSWYTDNSPLILEVMDNIRPSIATTIRETTGGTKWLDDSLIGIKNLLIQRE